MKTVKDQCDEIRKILVDQKYPATPSAPAGVRAIRARVALFEALRNYQNEVEEVTASPPSAEPSAP